MRYLLTGLLFIIHFSSYSQNVIWKEYIDDNNKDNTLSYLHTHGNNRYIFSVIENYSGSKIYDDYIIAMTKTTLTGDLMWTKYFRPGGVGYKLFDLEKIIFKDSIIVIYSTCSDTFSYNHKFICELTLDGEERFSKVYAMRGTPSIHLSLTDSNTIEYVYNDNKSTKHAYVERYNKKHELIYIDSGLITYHPQVYRVHKSNIYTQDLFMTDQNKLGIKLFHHDMNWSIVDSAILVTDITMHPSNVPLFNFPEYGNNIINNELAIWGLFDYSSTDIDNFYIRINLVTKQLTESFSFKRLSSEKYVLNNNSSIYQEYKNNTYALYKTYNKDSVIKYKYRLVKFKNGNALWNTDLKVDSSISIDVRSKSVSMEMRDDKLLAVINYFNNKSQLGELVSEYDTNGNYIRSYQSLIDTGASTIGSIQTIYNNASEILSLARVTLKGKSDRDLLWKKTSFEPAGFTSTKSTDVNLYPNPAYKTITIDGIPEDDFSVEVFDLLGNRLLQKTNDSTIDIEILIKGIYMLKVNTSMGMLVKKFIKE